MSGFTYSIDRKNRMVTIVRIYRRDPWEDHTKAKFVRGFLHREREFFSAQEISEILKVDRKTIEPDIASLKKKENLKKKQPGRLKTWPLKFMRVWEGDDVKDPSNWEEEEEGSNFDYVIHKDDFKSYLESITTTAYDSSRTGFSIIKEQGEDVVKRFKKELDVELPLVQEEIDSLVDSLYRKKSKQLANKQFLIIIQHTFNKEDLDVLLDRIVNREVTLHSKTSMKQFIERSDRSLQMFIKCYNQIVFTIAEKRKTTRAIFDIQSDTADLTFNKEHNEIVIENIVTDKLKSLFAHKVKLLQMDCPPWMPFIELNVDEGQKPEFLDYYSAYISGYRNPPIGYSLVDGVEYLAIDKQSAEWELGLPLITPVLEKEEKVEV